MKSSTDTVSRSLLCTSRAVAPAPACRNDVVAASPGAPAATAGWPSLSNITNLPARPAAPGSTSERRAASVGEITSERLTVSLTFCAT